MYVCGNVWLNYSWNEKVSETVLERIETHILHLIQFCPKIVQFRRQLEKYATKRPRIAMKDGACALRTG